MAAYSRWPSIYHDYSSAVSGLQVLGTLLLALFIILLSFEQGRRLRRALAVLIILVHIGYLAAYMHAYSMELRILPFFDLLSDEEGHANLTLDLAQVMLLYLALSYMMERRRGRGVDKRGVGAAAAEGQELLG